MSIFKNKRFLFSVITSLIIVIIFSFFYFQSNNDSNNTKDDESAEEESNDSLENVPEESEEEVVVDEGPENFIYKNAANFTTTNYTNINDFGGEDCPIDTAPFAVDIAIHQYDLTAKDELLKQMVTLFDNDDTSTKSIYSYTFTNLSNYLAAGDIQLQNGYAAITKLLNGEVDINTSAKSGTFAEIFRRSCTGEFALSPAYIEKLDYEGTDASYLVIFYGSNHYVPDAISLSLEPNIYSKIGDNYNMISLGTVYYSNELTTSNTLAACEHDSDAGYGYKALDKDSDCVETSLQTTLDHTKLDSVVDYVLNIFELVE